MFVDSLAVTSLIWLAEVFQFSNCHNSQTTDQIELLQISDRLNSETTDCTIWDRESPVLSIEHGLRPVSSVVFEIFKFFKQFQMPRTRHKAPNPIFVDEEMP